MAMKGLMLLWAVSALAPTAFSLVQIQKDLEPTFPFAITRTPERTEFSRELLSGDDKAIARRAAIVIAATEAALKAALINGNTVTVTQNIILTSTITIDAGTVTVSCAPLAVTVSCATLLSVSDRRSRSLQY